MLVGCGRVRTKIQFSRRELHTHVHLNYARVEFISCKKKKKEIERRADEVLVHIKKEEEEDKEI